jgi:trehalose-6-phosphate synthase
MSACLDGGCLFFSVERFDYTKGIKEKMAAIQTYFTNYQDRIGKDVFYQIAVMNRRSVESYRQYQDDCIAAAENVNLMFKSPDAPDWKPIRFQTDGKCSVINCMKKMIGKLIVDQLFKKIEISN